MYDRSDGLLRGSREDRVQQVFALQASDWDFDTLLGIMQGLLDHAEDVRLAAMETLLEIARQKNFAMSLTPISVIEYFMFNFTASSGAVQQVFRFLVENKDLPEARQAIERALLSNVRNEDFEQFIDILVEARAFAKGLEPSTFGSTALNSTCKYCINKHLQCVFWAEMRVAGD